MPNPPLATSLVDRLVEQTMKLRLSSGTIGSGDLVSPLPGLLVPRTIAEHPTWELAAASLPSLREGSRGEELCIALGPKLMVCVAGGPRKVPLATVATLLPGTLVLHTHTRESGPSPQDLRVLSHLEAAGLILVTPRAHWFVDLTRGVDHEILEAAEAAATRITTRRLAHLAATMLDLLGLSWSRVPGIPGGR